MSTLCLGTTMLGDWANHDPATGVEIVRHALDEGINCIDTADFYAGGQSEAIVGKALAGRRDEVVLMTKFGLPMGSQPNCAGGSRRWIRQAVQASLRRLGTDWIDIYLMHRPDPCCDVDETLGALSDLVRDGIVRCIGTSTFPAHDIVEGQWVAERRGRERFLCEHPPYSLLARNVEADVLPTCQKFGIGVMTWSPLHGGWLSGRYRRDAPLPESSRAQLLPWRFDAALPENQRKLEAAYAFADLADEAGMPLIDLAIGAVLKHPAVSSAIIGPRTLEHLASELRAAEANIPADLMDRVDAIVPPGVTLNERDANYVPLSLQDPGLRRRP